MNHRCPTDARFHAASDAQTAEDAAIWRVWSDDHPLGSWEDDVGAMLGVGQSAIGTPGGVGTCHLASTLAGRRISMMSPTLPKRDGNMQ